MRYLLLLLLMITQTQAQEVPAYLIKSTSNCYQGRCTEQFGTGILIKIKDGHGWFLTVKHVVAGNPSVLLGDHYYKLSVIQEWNSPGIIPDGITLLRTVEPIPSSDGRGYPSHYLRNRAPQPGDKVWIIGFPFKEYKYKSTIVTEVNSVKFMTRAHLEQGSSGGLVVYQADNSLAGVIHGYVNDTQEGVNTRGDYIYGKMTSLFSELLPKDAERSPDTDPHPDPGIVDKPKPKPTQGITKKELESTIKKWKLEQDKTLKESLQVIISENQAQHEVRKQEIQQNNEESLDQYSELKDILSNIGDQFNQVSDEQSEQIEDIKKKNKTFQEKFWEKIENPDSDYFKPRSEGTTPYTAPNVVENPVVIPEKPLYIPEDVILKEDGNDSGLFSSVGKSMLGIPWLSILGGLGVAIPGGAAGFLALKGLSLLLSRKRGNDEKDGDERKEFGESGDNTQQPMFQVPKRDVTEAKQILGLRQYEQREPVLDALRGVLFQDELQNNPDKPLKDAVNAVNDRFNQIAPITTQHEVQTRNVQK